MVLDIWRNQERLH